MLQTNSFITHTHNIFQRKKDVNATYIQCKITHGKDLDIGANCAALRAVGMMLYPDQLALHHSDMAILISEPQ